MPLREGEGKVESVKSQSCVCQEPILALIAKPLLLDDWFLGMWWSRLQRAMFINGVYVLE